VKLGVKITRVDVQNAGIKMDDGKVWTGDLLICAEELILVLGRLL
jgi:hypothetical protein